MERDTTDGSRDPAIELALRAARVGIWSWDVRADVVHWSPEVYELFELDPAEFEPTFGGFLDHVPESYRSRLRSEIEAFVQAKDPEAEYRVVFPVEVPSGPHRWVEARGELRLDERGRAEELLGIVQDITERRRAEDERLRLERRMLQAQKLESLGILAGGIAHDFNNLLVAVQGNAELARLDLPPASPVHPYLEEICAASQRAAGLCQQMLAYSGQGKVRVEALDLGELVRDMARILTVSLSKKAELRLDLSPDLPAIRGDATQLRQVLMNLIINANEALGDGRGTIEVLGSLREASAREADAAVLGEVPPGPMVVLEVRDDGCGMDAPTRQKMFDPFFTTKTAGRGLGMAAVLGIAAAHGGSVSVESQPGEGTAVRVLLPPSEQAVASGEVRDQEDTWRGEGTVLVVDDEPDARRVSQRMLERLGLDVVVARHGREAVDVFTARRRGLSLVLLDLTMPEMDGVETLSALREMEGPEVPILVTSGYAPEEVRARFAAHEVAGFLYKPYRLDTLRSTLRSVLSPSSATSAAPTAPGAPGSRG